MRVTLRAACGQSKPRGSGRGHAVRHRVETKLQRINAAFFVQHRVAMKSSRDPLCLSRIGKHVARKLFNRKLIKWHVGVNRIDHPIAIRPNRTLAIFFVAVRVSVACQVQPATSPAFTVCRPREQFIDQRLPCRLINDG